MSVFELDGECVPFRSFHQREPWALGKLVLEELLFGLQADQDFDASRGCDWQVQHLV